jgi:hypothetical protein
VAATVQSSMLFDRAAARRLSSAANKLQIFPLFPAASSRSREAAACSRRTASSDRALRKAQFRHRHFESRPLAIVLYQLVVANSATAKMLDRLGRRLAYLPTTGPQPADEALVRLGRHLRFLANRMWMPGQQLLVSLTDVLNDHWMSAQSELERQSLAAVDAFIEPPGALNGFEAAARVEDDSVGPIPGAEDDERLEPLIEEFNELRRGRTTRDVVEPLLGPIEDHYRPLVERAWSVLWRCRHREAKFSEAP